MTDLTPLCALGAPEPRRTARGALSLTENPDLALASLALRAGETQPAPFGLTLPGPGAFNAAGEVLALWTGPGQWMLAAERSPDADFAAELRAQAPGCSITEQTGGWCCVEIASATGAAPLDRLLEKLVNLPPAALCPGRAARTGLHHLSVFVIRRSTDRLAVLGMSSAAGSLWHALDAAALRLESFA
ncbi:sarcosine oxidase subunit gamma [Salipiger sp. 1_MG-2023]|uniref:sarcosine oxidase subunit gamma n=1 Tax=Salipiger sp. 1_MG-2023 TaxID=3062665 RepID=UPI0026E30591|nr:sarcosine oxidase subunit gamma [Salipiger sp. 1_MG-2023]MDO6587594.1 sarcosine oxidase subunit gamma [Salipiger sp. 1_MG-2023]